jgi:DNA-binding HxlR family transcriptional regulator
MSSPIARVTTCTHSLKLLADFWTLRIIESLLHGEQRYCELQRAVGNVNPTTLTKKLNELEAAGLLARSEDSGGHSVSYTLTTLGKDSLPVLEAIKSFSKKFERAQKK